jgi:hypothetical protein
MLMKRACSFAFSILLVCASVDAVAQANSNEQPAHTVALEVKQFDFLVGEWQLEVLPKASGLAAMIHGAPRLTGTWKAWRAFDGLGIEDELRIVDASGNPISLSHALRIYAKTEGHWNVSLLDAYRAHFSDSTGQWQAGEMRMDSHGTDAEGKPYLSRTRYYEIASDSFRMQQDRSVDNGQSWDEAVLTINAKRTPTATQTH